MPLHPDAAAALARLKTEGWVPRRTLTPQQAREQQQRTRVVRPIEPLFAVEDWVIPKPFGSIPVRFYRPSPGVLPALLFFHGGGWVTGDIDMADVTCSRLANQAGCLVVSVGYRLAPEDRFPAALDDCYAAVVWLVDKARALGVDSDHIAVSGVSAGGNLAAAVCLMARDQAGPRIAHQLLVCPVLDTDFERPSYIENAEGFQLERGDMIWFWEQYLGDMALAESPYAAPMRAGSLCGLPRAHIITAEFDPLRDEGAAYAGRLMDDGVDVTLRCCPGMLHGVLGSPIPEGRAAFDQACHLLQASLSST